MTIGEKIRMARRLRDYTQAELGRMVKLPGDMIRKYENDVRTPKADRLAMIAEKLEIDISSLSDINITSVEDILHVLFELEDSYGMTIEKNNGSYNLKFDKSLLEDADKRNLIYALDSWYEYIKISESLSTTEKDNDKEYPIWKMRYPLDKKTNETKQVALVHDKYTKINKTINTEKPDIITFKDIIIIFEKMLKAGIQIDFFIEHLGVGQGLGIFCFNNSQLLSLDDTNAIKFANFIYAMDKLNEYGITIQQGAYTFESDTYTEYYVYSSQISTMILTLKELQQWIKENSLEELENLCKYKDALKWMNVPIKEYV